MSFKQNRLASKHVGRKFAAAVSSAVLVAPTVMAAVPQVALAADTAWGAGYTVEAGENGSVVVTGNPSTATFTANQGFVIDTLTDSGSNHVDLSSYSGQSTAALTFDAGVYGPTGKITATFRAEPAQTTTTTTEAGLYDADSNGDPIDGSNFWANTSIVRNISEGVKDMTFLWRSASDAEAGTAATTLATVKVGKGIAASFNGNAVTVNLLDRSATLQRYVGTLPTDETELAAIEWEDVKAGSYVQNLNLLAAEQDAVVNFRVKPGSTSGYKTFNVIYHAQNGTHIIEDTGVSATNVVKSDEAAQDGKKFLGWATTVTGVEPDGNGGTNSTIKAAGTTYKAAFGIGDDGKVAEQDQHLYAQFGSYYQIAFDGNGGFLKESVTTDLRTKAGGPLRSFGNEASADDLALYIGCDSAVAYHNAVADADVTYKTYWDGRISAAEGYYYKNDAKGNALYFAGWKVGDKFVKSVSDITESMISNGKVTLVAQWAPMPLSRITVDWEVSSNVTGYDSENGDIADAYATENDAARGTLAAATGKYTNTDAGTVKVNDDGYAFWGWNTKADGTGYGFKDGEGFSQADAMAIAQSVTNSKLTLYAIWKPAYVVVLDSNVEDGGKKAEDAQTNAEKNTGVVIDEQLVFVGEPATIAKWLKQRNATTGAYEGVQAYEDVKFYYQGRNDATSHTRTLSGWATSAKGTPVIADGGATTAAVDALRVKDKAYGYKVVLYARWDDKATYTVTFYPNYATDDDVAAATLVAGGSVRNLDAGATFKRSGYKLLYWTTDREGNGTRFNPGFGQTAALDALGASSVANNVQLFAIWGEALDVTLSSGDGTGADTKVILTTTDSLPANPGFTNAGKEFDGWATDEAGTKKVSTYAEAAAAAEDGKVTLYAVWKDKAAEPEVKLGWYKDADGEYHYRVKNADGTISDAKGWSRGGTKKYYYYFDETTGKMLKNTWKKSGAYWYHFGPRGNMEHDKPIAYKGVNYWLNSRGAAVKA